MKKFISAVFIVLATSLLLAGCTHAENPDSKGTSTSDSDDSSVAVDVEITASHLSFSPNVIEINAGETIRVRITSQDDLHDFNIDELDVSSGLINSGNSAVVEITAPIDASGDEYEFYCSVSNHRASGMVGTIKVL